jgi:hypothetical protein
MEQPRTRWFGQVTDDIKKRGKNGKDLKRKACGKMEEFGFCSSALIKQK